MVNSGRPVSMSIGDRVMRDGAVKLPKPKKSASSEIASTAVPVGSGGVSNVTSSLPINSDNPDIALCLSKIL